MCGCVAGLMGGWVDVWAGGCVCGRVRVDGWVGALAGGWMGELSG